MYKDGPSTQDVQHLCVELMMVGSGIDSHMIWRQWNSGS